MHLHRLIIEDDWIWITTQGGKGGDTRETEVPTKGKNPGADRDLGAGQGRKGIANGSRTQ